MKWKGRRESSNVEDRRGMSGGGKTVMGGGIGGIVIVLLFMLLGGNPGDLLNNLTSVTTTNTGSGGTPYHESAQEKELRDFVSVVLADTEDEWSAVFKERGMKYENPKLVLYKGSIQSACGQASSAVGPFYCPGDHKLYIDLSFYQELKDKFKAPGDFAMAYVIAHEVGHHVQTLLHLGDNETTVPKGTNAYSVRFELQADYLAGVWAHYAQGKGYLEKGDLEEALQAANAVGDDTLQKQAQGYAVPDTFTHGTSEQRMRWFKKGFEKGTIPGGDTFNAPNL